MMFDAETLKILEWAAMALGLINIALLVFRSQWNFAFAIASVSLYVFIFFESRLYAESGLQIFFILANIWGWVLWYRAAQDGIDDAQDNCASVFNPVRPMDGGAQPNLDSDALGDACLARVDRGDAKAHVLERLDHVLVGRDDGGAGHPQLFEDLVERVGIELRLLADRLLRDGAIREGVEYRLQDGGLRVFGILPLHDFGIGRPRCHQRRTPNVCPIV